MKVLLALLLSGCYAESFFEDEPPQHETCRAYTTSVPEDPTPSLGEWVHGTDGTFGWRSTHDDVDGIFRQATEKAVNHHCRLDAYVDNEMRGECDGIRVLVRHDTEHVYRLCEAGTDVPACVSTWSLIRR
jgi:hypothetical protein